MGRSGTGLGLAVVWNTVQDLGGTVDVTSNASGTTFEVRLPASGEITDVPPEQSQANMIHGNGERILVIDDDMHQRKVTTEMLDFLDYNPETVSSGEEALSFVKNNRVDLLVLDMIMPPGMGGLETYERILNTHPGQKAILISGFSAGKDVEKAIELGASNFVQKPYAVEKLASAIYVALKE